MTLNPHARFVLHYDIIINLNIVYISLECAIAISLLFQSTECKFIQQSRGRVIALLISSLSRANIPLLLTLSRSLVRFGSRTIMIFSSPLHSYAFNQTVNIAILPCSRDCLAICFLYLPIPKYIIKTDNEIQIDRINL